MKVNVSMDGSPFGTRVTTPDGGDLSSRVTGVSIRHDAGGVPQVEVEMATLDASILDAPAIVLVGGRQVKRIEYADGTAEEFD